MPTGTVTITQGGSTAAGTDGFCFVFTGQNASPIGISQSATNTTPSLATGTGVTTGSLVVASNLGLAGTYTANADTTYKFDHQGQGLEYISMISAATMTGGVSKTIGGTAGVNSISIVLLEILKGSGALALDSSTPAGFTSTGLSATSASFTPPASSLLVVAAQTNGNVVVTATVSDTGLGLTWTERVKQNTSGNGYSGIWTAPVPAAAVSAGMLAGWEA
jgi:hypothetical protein